MECEGQTIEHDTVRIHTGDFARANGAGVDQRIEPLVLRHHRARGPGERGDQRGAQNAMSGGHATIVPQSALLMVPIVVYKQGTIAFSDRCADRQRLIANGEPEGRSHQAEDVPRETI